MRLPMRCPLWCLMWVSCGQFLSIYVVSHHVSRIYNDGFFALDSSPHCLLELYRVFMSSRTDIPFCRLSVHNTSTRSMATTKRRYKALPLFASPLEEHLEHYQGHEYDSDEQRSHSGAELTLGKGGATTEAHQTRPDLYRMPMFREREEASSMELFYDLFFVANLSSFTGVHSIDDVTSMPTITSSHLNPQVLTTRQRLNPTSASSRSSGSTGCKLPFMTYVSV